MYNVNFMLFLHPLAGLETTINFLTIIKNFLWSICEINCSGPALLGNGADLSLLYYLTGLFVGGHQSSLLLPPYSETQLGFK